MTAKPKTLLFLDIETTGLKRGAQLLELAAILVRGHDLQIVSRFHTLVKCWDGPSDAGVWDPFVVAMHSKNMLMADIADPKKEAAEDVDAALRRFAAFLKQLGQPAKSCYITGSSVQTDIAFLKAIDEANRGEDSVTTIVPWNEFSHRILDLSSLRTFDTMSGAKLFPEKKADENHRAMGDCEQDLEQLREATKKAGHPITITISGSGVQGPVDYPR